MTGRDTLSPSRRKPVNSRLVALATGAGLCEFGDVLFFVAFIADLYLLAGSARTVGFVLVAFSVGNLLGALLGGLLIDRLPARAWLGWGNLGTAALVVVFAYATPLPMVAALALLVGLVGRALLIGQQACIPLTEPAVLLRANSVFMSSRRLGQLAGPFLGGTLVAVGHAREAYLINAATFVLSAVAILIALPAGARVHRPGDHTDAPPIRILDYARRTPAVRASFFVQCVIGIIGGTANTLLVVYATETLHGGPGSFGILITFTAIGAIIGGFTTGILARHTSPKWATAACLAVSGCALGLLPAVPWLALAVVLRAAGGWAWNVLNIILLTNLHEGAPSRLQGRIIGFTRSGQDICLIVFTALAGTAVTLIGTTAALITAGVLGVLSGVALALTRRPFDWSPRAGRSSSVQHLTLPPPLSSSDRSAPIGSKPRSRSCAISPVAACGRMTCRPSETAFRPNAAASAAEAVMASG